MKIISYVVGEMNDAVKEDSFTFSIDAGEIKKDIQTSHEEWIKEDLIPLYRDKGEDAVREEIVDAFAANTVLEDLYVSLAEVIGEMETDDDPMAVSSVLTSAFTTVALTLTDEDKNTLVGEFIDIVWARFKEIAKSFDGCKEGDGTEHA